MPPAGEQAELPPPPEEPGVEEMPPPPGVPEEAQGGLDRLLERAAEMMIESELLGGRLASDLARGLVAKEGKLPGVKTEKEQESSQQRLTEDVSFAGGDQSDEGKKEKTDDQ